MSLASDFELAWKPVGAAVSAALLLELKEHNAVTLECAEQAWKRELRHWHDPMRPQGSFLKGLEKKNPACAKKLMSAMEAFAFQEAQLPPVPSGVPYAAGGVICAALGALVGFVLPASFFLPRLIGRIPTVLLGAALFAGVGGGLLHTMWQVKAEAARADCSRLYTDQLDVLHEMLRELCEKAG